MSRPSLRSTVVAGLAVALLATVPVTAAVSAGEPTVRLLVTFRASASERTQDSVAASEGTVVREIDEIDLHAIEVPARRADVARKRLLRRGDVRVVEPDTVLVADKIPNDPSYASQWAPPKVKLPAAWDTTTGSAAIVIAIIDTGVTPTSPDLPSTKLVPGRNVINSSSNAADDNGHGTSSASVAAMVGDNGSRAAGACWQCRIMPVKVLGSNGSGSSSNVAAGITWAANNGADVISLSLSGGGTTALKNSVAYAESKGIPVVASAGNGSTSAQAYPAAYSSVLSIGATDQNDRATSYTNRGSWVRLAAPGTNLALNRSGSVVSFSGTSSAAPLVSGTIGLLLSVNPSLTPAQVRSTLMSTADPANITLAPGSGRLDAQGAMAAIGGGVTTTTVAGSSTTASTTSTTAATTTTASTTTSSSTTTTTSATTTTAPSTTATVTGGGFTSTGVVTRSLSAKAGPTSFNARCSWCSSQRLDILSGTTVIATLSGGANITLNATLPANGTYTYRVTTSRWATARYTITYRP